MVPVPQELIDAIVNEVKDVKGLKACSLTASAFREPSQRMLIHSLTLSGDASRPSVNAWCARLTESPRIARYITTFTIYLSFEDTEPSAVQTLQTIFARLTNVCRCVFASNYDFCRWEDLTPVAQIVVDFIKTQKLTELNVRYFANLPPSVLACFLSAAPKISFLYVKVDIDAIGEPLSTVTMAPSKPKQLLLAVKSRRVCDALTRPEFSSYMSDLRILEVRPEPEYRIGMLSSAATQLEHICFDCTLVHSRSAVPPLSSFIGLRCIELRIDVYEYMEPSLLPGVPWLLYTLPSILSDIPPNLEEICITFVGALFPPPSLLRPETMRPLNRALAACPAAPRIRWRHGFDEDEEHLAFITAMQEGLPAVHEKGKLIIDWYYYESGDSWAISF